MLDSLTAALAKTGFAFAHFGWSHAPADDYGVYAEDGENVLLAGDVHAETALTGTVDYFTRDDTDAPRTTIEAALESSGVAWELNSIQYENDTGYIHYEWIFEAVG